MSVFSTENCLVKNCKSCCDDIAKENLLSPEIMISKTISSVLQSFIQSRISPSKSPTIRSLPKYKKGRLLTDSSNVIVNVGSVIIMAGNGRGLVFVAEFEKPKARNRR